MKLSVYLLFGGTTEEAMTFYGKVFKTDFVGEIFRSESGGVMNCQMMIQNVLVMSSDTEQDLSSGQASNVVLTIYADSLEEATYYYESLSEDGQINRPLKLEFWGEYFADVIDKYGVSWYISYVPKQ